MTDLGVAESSRLGSGPSAGTLGIITSMVKVTIFIFLMVANLGFAEELPNPAPSPTVCSQTEEQHKSGTNQEKTGDYTPPNQPVPAINEIKSKYSERMSSNKDNDATQPATHNDPSQSPVLTNWWVTIFTGVLAAAAIVQLSIYARQAHYMGEQLKIASESAKAAQVGADAATVNANIARDTLHLTQRAYIHFDHSCLSQEKITLPQGAGEIDITCYFNNFGLTQGTLTTGYVDKMICKDTPPVPDYPNHSNIWSGTETVSPKGEAIFPIPIVLETTEIEAIKNGAMLFFYGYFTYRDIFDKKREIAFFMQYDPNKERFFKVHRPGYNYST